MLSNPLASSSLPKREVWKCFKSSLLTNLFSMLIYVPHVLAEPRESQSLSFSGLFAKFCTWGSCGSKRDSAVTELKNVCTIASLSTQSAWHLAQKYRLEQHIPNETLDFTVKFQLVFRYESVVFRRYVLALLLVGLWRKFEAYLVYLSLIWGKIPRRYSCFQKFRHFSYMFPGFPAQISDMRNHFSALSNAVAKNIANRSR